MSEIGFLAAEAERVLREREKEGSLGREKGFGRGLGEEREKGEEVDLEREEGEGEGEGERVESLVAAMEGVERFRERKRLMREKERKTEQPRRGWKLLGKKKRV